MDGKVAGYAPVGKKEGLLTPEMADSAERQRVRHFLDSMQTAILEANCLVMSQTLQGLNRDTLLRMAVRVAELRADYIRLGMDVASRQHPDAEALLDLKRRREAYQEMAQAFEAAERVIERGYIRLD